MQFIITATFALISLVGLASPCPSVCSCNFTVQGFTVDCSLQELSSIPTDLPNNTNILLLYLNVISIIDDHAFNNLPALHHLYLYYNKISKIDKIAFSNLPALYTIELSYNQISEIERGTFNIPTLITLNLDYNKITGVEAWLFSGMRNIQSISMDHNNISFVSNQTFQNLSMLTTLKFTMFCGCNFNIPFWQWFIETRKFPSSIGCYDYPKLHLEDLVQGDFYKCNEARFTPSTTKSRTTATPTSRTTATPTRRTTITTTSAAIITRKKLEATAFAPRTVIGIAIGAGSLAGGILLLCVIWRLWRRSKDKDIKFEQQQDKINSVIPAIPPSTFPQKANRKATVYHIE